MSVDVTIRAIVELGEQQRLAEFIHARQGEDAARLFASHLAQARYRSAFTRAAFANNALIGYALIRHERRRLGVATLEVGWLDDIYIPPDWRGRGAFRALLGDYLGVLVEHDFPFAMLHGPVKLYAPFGFAPYRFGAAALGEARSAETSAQLRSATLADSDDLAALYAANYRDLPLTEVRAATDWRWRFAQGGKLEVLQDRQERVVAYAAVEQRLVRTKLRVVEAAAADAGVARVLITALLAQAYEQGLAHLYLALAPEHCVSQAALQMGGIVHVAAAPEQGNRYGHADLAGIVRLSGALAMLTPELERRLALSHYAGWSGTIQIELETGRIILTFQDGRVAISNDSRAFDLRLRKVKVPALAQLCLGYRAPADLRATGDLDCDDTALSLFDVLFPVVMACGENEDWWLEA
ncbi:MAG: GNAT family N-acetyltransferase [Chloroflexales bacterium]|nr:GNAT family N-acetyltransferase [Chloroflexales bacterium]